MQKKVFIIAARIMHLFEELSKLGTTIVIATHNKAMVSATGHSVLSLENGVLTVQREAARDPSKNGEPMADNSSTRRRKSAV